MFEFVDFIYFFCIIILGLPTIMDCFFFFLVFCMKLMSRYDFLQPHINSEEKWFVRNDQFQDFCYLLVFLREN